MCVKSNLKQFKSGGTALCVVPNVANASIYPTCMKITAFHTQKQMKTKTEQGFGAHHLISFAAYTHIPPSGHNTMTSRNLSAS